MKFRTLSMFGASALGLASAVFAGGSAQAAGFGDSVGDHNFAASPMLGNWEQASLSGIARNGMQMRRGPGFGGNYGGLPRNIGSYHRPFRGFTLPRFWIAPRFFLTNYRVYNLPQPATGYSWSRYYNDAVLTDSNGRVYDSVYDVEWDRYENHDDGRRYEYDYDVNMHDDNVVYGQSVPVAGAHTPVATQAGGYEGAWSGSYIGEDGRVYQGSWAGEYRDESGAVYDGEYSGTFIGEGQYVDNNGRIIEREYVDHHDGVDYAPPYTEPAHPPVTKHVYKERRHDGDRYDHDRYADHRSRAEYMERCRRDNGLGGALIGGAVGAVAGNRIAGRGNRTAGTLIGGAVGAVAGAAIDVSEDDRCEGYEREYRRDDRQYRHPTHGYYRQSPGYYWYYPAPTVTTVIVQPATTTTTTTTTYEDVYTSQPSNRRWRKKAQPINDCNC